MFQLAQQSPKRKAPERGRRYGRLVVVRLEKTEGGRRYWRCRCDCTGKNVVVPTRYLTSGETRSCGCLRIDHGRATMRRRYSTDTAA